MPFITSKLVHSNAINLRSSALCIIVFFLRPCLSIFFIKKRVFNIKNQPSPNKETTLLLGDLFFVCVRVVINVPRTRPKHKPLYWPIFFLLGGTFMNFVTTNRHGSTWNSFFLHGQDLIWSTFSEVQVFNTLPGSCLRY